MRKPFTHLAIVLGLLGGLLPLAVQADIYVVVNAENPQRALTQKEVLDLFMGRTRSFDNGDYALMFDLPRDSATRASFYEILTGMSPAQVNSYWARLMFTGQTQPPLALPNEAGVLEVIKRNPSAIGYVSQAPMDKSLRTVFVVKESH